MMVSPASRILRAISFGVLCRSAPSTSLIMRSINVAPGAAVMRTRIQSDSTCVPPVTAERSPPASRMTGADSPVIAASLTEAMPSITSPSDGIVSPASTSTTSPTLRSVLGTRRWLFLSEPLRSLAWVSVRCRRNKSDCPLPRPSAIASEKLANSTVIHSHTMIWNVKNRFSPPMISSRTKMIVVSAATTSTTNMTGFLISVRGSSLAKAEPTAGHTIFGSNSADTGVRLRVVAISSDMDVTPKLVRHCEQGAGLHREMLDDRPERERGKVDEAANDEDHADEEADEQRAVGWERTCRGRHGLLHDQGARHRHHRNDDEVASDQHRQAARRVVPRRIPGESGEGRAVVAGLGYVQIKHFAEAVRTRILNAG